MTDATLPLPNPVLPPVIPQKWPAHLSVLLLTLATFVSLLPFSGKAFHIDDPLYLWTAQHIVQHPLDPFGFRVVWYDTATPIGDLINNPPLAPYYAAAWGASFGWSERVMHLAFFFPALAVVLCTFQLARCFTQHAVWAALLTLFSPGFLVSSTTVMCDVLMLAFWMAAVLLWLHAIDSGRPVYFLAAACMVAACALSKFFGIALFLLLPCYSLLRRRCRILSLVSMVGPLFALLLYQRWTHRAYGSGLLAIAMQYASFHNRGHELPLLTRALLALTFAGGCAIPALLFIPSLWPRKWIAAGLAITAAIGAAVARHWIFLDSSRATLHWNSISTQLAFLALGGLSLLALALLALRGKNADAALLSLWVLGTLCFSGFVNWTINARSILPLVPAVAILLMRRLEQTGQLSAAIFPRQLALPLLASGVLSIWTAAADASLANAGREAARLIRAEFQDSPTPVYFEGHWGFQYYMQQFGARPTDLQTSLFRTGDVVVIPENTTNSFGPPAGFTLGSIRLISFALPGRVATMSQPLGAGFYASVWGPLPFSFGPVPPERYLIARLVPAPGNPNPAPMVLKP